MPAAPRPVEEADYGIHAYLTRAEGIGGRTKSRPEDFRVMELGPAPEPDERGPYTAVRVELTNTETHGFVRDAARALQVSRNRVRFSGTKDKRAVTQQWFTIKAPAADVERALGTIPNARVLETYPTAQELDLGAHQGNRFEITVTQATHGDAISQAKAILEELRAFGGVPNYYGPQRFGTLRATTHRVGRLLLEGNVREALEYYVYALGGPEQPRMAEARAAFGVHRDPAAALKAFDTPHTNWERTILQGLVETPDNPVAVLKRLPKNLQTMFVFAHQSYLFNQMLSRRIKQGLPLLDPVPGDLVAVMDNGNPTGEWLPVTEANVARVRAEAARGRFRPTALLPGTEAPAAGGAMGRIEVEVLEEAGQDRSSFVVPEAPWLTSKGSRRPLAVALPDVELRPTDDGVVLAFDLPKGAYATVVLREFLKSPDVRAYG